MGEVYRAHDTKLKRQVAIKILPPSLAEDPARLTRFQREAELLASLNHPNIAQIYGLETGQVGPALPALPALPASPASPASPALPALPALPAFIVMELVEGEDLSQRLTHGAIRLDEALPLARQVADALEAAHEQGIIHRDLKPANIRVRADGTVKVLDFGLAKALDPIAQPAGDPTNSPTLTAIGTHAGIILGTAAYMAPEQAKGKPVDRRADVWAFGVVLLEMLTGRNVYTGETVAETLARVIEREPDFSALPRTTPASIRNVLARCLTKDPRARLQAIGEARIAIERALAHPEEETAPVGFTGGAARGANASRPRWQRVLPWGIAAAFAAATAVTLITQPSRQPAQTPLPLRLSAELGADISPESISALALSPDGSVLAFVGERARSTELYLRRLGGLRATAISGTSGARDPFFAPDGQWIGFFAEGKLKKIPVTGGEAVRLSDAPSAAGGSWADDGRITFAYSPSPQSRLGLQRVSAAGGTPEPLTTLEPGESAHRWPQVLPEGTAVLYTALRAGGSARASIPSFEDASIVVQPLPAGPRKTLVQGGYHARYLSSGHIVYVHEGTLFAAPFDLDRMEITGDAVPALEGLSSSGSAYAVSSKGLLVYRAGNTRDDAPIVWMDKTGKTTPLRSVPSDWSNPRFSPDGRKLAIDISDGRQVDVWVYEWMRDALMRLTSDASNDSIPVWTPDGRRIAFASTRGDKTTLNIYWQRADGSGDAERLTDTRNAQLPGAWHPSGKYLVFQENVPQTGLDLFILPMQGDEASGWKPGTPTVFVNTPFLESAPAFSPDGKWIAYHSNELGGGTEIFVRPFPGPGGKWLISTGGGGSPMWSSVRRELFYRNQDNQIVVVPYTVEGDAFHADKPRLWSERPIRLRPRQRPFDVHPDGDRFAVAVDSESENDTRQDRAVFVLDFFDELRRLVAP